MKHISFHLPLLINVHLHCFWSAYLNNQCLHLPNLVLTFPASSLSLHNVSSLNWCNTLNNTALFKAFHHHSWWDHCHAMMIHWQRSHAGLLYSSRWAKACSSSNSHLPYFFFRLVLTTTSNICSLDVICQVWSHGHVLLVLNIAYMHPTPPSPVLS